MSGLKVVFFFPLLPEEDIIKVVVDFFLFVTSYLDEMAKDFTHKLDFLGELIHTEREARLATEQSLALLQDRLTRAEETVGTLTIATASPPPPPPQAPGSTPGPTHPVPAAPPSPWPVIIGTGGEKG